MFETFNPFARLPPRRTDDAVPKGEPSAHPASPPPERAAQHPRLAVALGGGAARGFAHIGVMRALERHGIVPDIVAGTSMGAVVGGVWAAGKLDALDAWARSLNKRNVLGLLDFVLGAPGIIGGRHLMDRMQAEIGHLSIEDLPVRFVAIATELGTGHEVWLTFGDLVQAIHASYCLPGIFTPAKVGGRWLMDGALVNPIPVSAARALGGDVVIAVNLNADTLGRGTVIQNHGEAMPVSPETAAEKKPGLGSILRPDRMLRRQFLASRGDGPDGISTVMIDAFNIIQDRISRSRLAGDPPDVMISPKLRNVGLFDFHRAKDAIAAGEEAAERMMAEVVDTLSAQSVPSRP